MTITATDDISATPTVVGIENVNFNLNAVTLPLVQRLLLLLIILLQARSILQ